MLIYFRKTSFMGHPLQDESIYGPEPPSGSISQQACRPLEATASSTSSVC